MRFLRRAVLAASLSLTVPLGLAITTDARASVSIAVEFDTLVKESTSVAIITPVEQKSVWENGRIYTYTRVHADQAVAGELASGGEAWVRTMGGVVGHIGQQVDGEPVLTVGRPSLLFLRAGEAGTLEVTARAQGQFPVTLDDTKNQKLIRSGSVGVLLPRKQAAAPVAAVAGQTPAAPTPAPALASDVLHNRKLDDGLRDISAAWKRLHASK